ncbi:MAG TPA: vanadium-dependent haloperoxidase [Ktedonobacterales bacterium]|nr:vanadium-dependent haloperoxidase [Ktedonobacterales bacterium]
MHRLIARWHVVVSGMVIVAICATLLAVGILRTTATPAKADSLSAQVVLDWNINAVSAVRSSVPTKIQIEGLVYMAYTQAAVYDAVTKIAGRYAPYHDFTADPTGASVEAAVISAAYHTLVAYLGDPGLVLQGKYTAALAALPAAGKAEGIAVGQAASDDIVALRAHDGRNAVITTPYGKGPLAPGLWIFAPPPSGQVPVTPWMAFMQPFMLQSATQFRVAPPPALTSTLFADDFNELKAFGSKTSTVRTPEQTAVAFFWAANVINQEEQALRDMTSTHHFDLVDTARALAMGSLVESDAGIACWDSKYFYQFWRPITAIQNAGLTGNPDLTADPTWTPLGITPAHPEYPSAHGCLTGASAEVYANLLHTERINVDIPGAQGGASTLTTSRHFDTVHDLDAEIMDARVWIGFHYRNSVRVGVDLGQDVANWDLARYFQPVGPGEGNGS